MFVRWNDTLKYYEYDTSAGQTGAGPWVQLPNIPYKDQANLFTTHQTIRAPVPYLAFNYLGGGPDGKNSRFEGVGAFKISHTNDADNVYLKEFWFYRNGDTYTPGNITAASAIYERGRSVPMGTWQAVPFNAANFYAGGGGGTWTVNADQIHNNRYAVVGNTMFWSTYLSWFNGNTIAGTVTTLNMTLPGGHTTFGVSYHDVSYAQEGGVGLIMVAGGSNYISVTRRDGSAFGVSPGWITTFVIELG